MPHPVSPPKMHPPPIVVSKTDSAAPSLSQADGSASLNTVFTAPSSNASIEAAYALCDILLNAPSIGFRGLQSYGVFAEIKKAAADKKSGLRRERAQNLLGALFERFPPKQRVSEVVLLMQDMADKGMLAFGGSKEEAMEKEVLREQMGTKLATLIPIVEGNMHDLKSEVEKQAHKTMVSLTALLSNDDVAPRIPVLIETMQKPSTQSLQNAIRALSQTTFVAVVTSPVLALLTPFLERSLNTPTTTQDVLRQTVVIVEILTKLVHDPIEARTFLPKLKPGVKAAADGASLPEIRELANRALGVIDKAMALDKENVVERTTAEDVAKVLDARIKQSNGLAGGWGGGGRRRPY